MTQPEGLGSWEAQREEQSLRGFPLSPGKKAGLGKVAIGSTHVWKDLCFSPFQLMRLSVMGVGSYQLSCMTIGVNSQHE